MNQYTGADRVPANFADNVERLHNDGKSPDEISGILKTSTDKVRIVLSDLGITPNKHEPKKGARALVIRRAVEQHQDKIHEREWWGL